MSNTNMMRKFRTAGVASGIFAIGAGIGWQFADLLFRGGPPMPMVASIQFEGIHPRQTFEPPRHEAVPAPQQGATENRPPQSEEARLSRWIALRVGVRNMSSRVNGNSGSNPMSDPFNR